MPIAVQQCTSRQQQGPWQRLQRQGMARQMMASGQASTHANSTIHFHTSRADAQLRGFRFRRRAPSPQELSRKQYSMTRSGNLI